MSNSERWLRWLESNIEHEAPATEREPTQRNRPNEGLLHLTPPPYQSCWLASTAMLLTKGSPMRVFASRTLLKTATRSFSAVHGPSPSLSALASRLKELAYDAETLYPQTIVWGSHDAFNHVNNVHFVRFFESQRMVFAESIAKDLGEKRQKEILTGKGVSFILAGINVKYRRPVTYPDTLLIGTKADSPLEKGTDRFTLSSAAYSLKAWEAHQSQPGSREPGPVCIADALCVTYDYDKLAKCAMPEDMRDVSQEQRKAEGSAAGPSTDKRAPPAGIQLAR